MPPEEIVGAFQRGLGLLERVEVATRRADSKNTGAVEWLVEARTRLEQALFLLKKFRQTELEHAEAERDVTALLRQRLSPKETLARQRDLSPKRRETGDAIKVYGEAFYYFAFQCKEAFDRLDGTGAFAKFNFDPVGVRTARNQMIAHPSGPNGVLVKWWTFNCDAGLVLQPESGTGPDRGLYPNAEEFIEQLTQRLERALANTLSN